MVDRELLKKAKDMGHDCYLEQKDLYRNIPWPDVDEYEPYYNQMVASYNEAKQLFESENKKSKK